MELLQQEVLFNWGILKFGGIQLNLNGQKEWGYKFSKKKFGEIWKQFVGRDQFFKIRKLILSFPFREEIFDEVIIFLKNLVQIESGCKSVKLEIHDFHQDAEFEQVSQFLKVLSKVEREFDVELYFEKVNFFTNKILNQFIQNCKNQTRVFKLVLESFCKSVKENEIVGLFANIQKIKKLQKFSLEIKIPYQLNSQQSDSENSSNLNKILYTELVDIFVVSNHSFSNLKTLKLKLFIGQFSFIFQTIQKFLQQRIGLRCYLDLFQQNQQQSFLDKQAQTKIIELIQSISTNKLKGIKLTNFSLIPELVETIQRQNKIKYLELPSIKNCLSPDLCNLIQSQNQFNNLRKVQIDIISIQNQDFKINLSHLQKLSIFKIQTKYLIYPLNIILPNKIISYKENYLRARQIKISLEETIQYPFITTCQRSINISTYKKRQNQQEYVFNQNYEYKNNFIYDFVMQKRKNLIHQVMTVQLENQIIRKDIHKEILSFLINLQNFNTHQETTNVNSHFSFFDQETDQ